MSEASTEQSTGGRPATLLSFNADAGRVLSGTLDIELQIEELAGIVVPTLGEWCWIVVTDEQGRLQGVASGHTDPERRAELASAVVIAAQKADQPCRLPRHTTADSGMSTIRLR